MAGGASRRMGPLVDPRAGKAALEFAGETLLGRVCRVAAAALRRVIVVAAPGQALPPLNAGVEIVRDSRPGAGPLAAILDGLRQALAGSPAPRTAVVLSCDVPLLSVGVLRFLVAEAVASGARWVLPVVASTVNRTNRTRTSGKVSTFSRGDTCGLSGGAPPAART
ncbi:MAG: hypothetical protein EBR23_06180, partial [Planctomycetia bacterium]|nr:hypothetical protein [Planctomycetia bacterium]